MCEFKSMILLKDRVYCPAETDRHLKMVEDLGIRDDKPVPCFVKIEIRPPNGDTFASVEQWNYLVDQDVLPEWYIEEHDKPRAYEALAKYAAERIFIGKDSVEFNGGGTFYVKDCKAVKAMGSATVEAWGSATVEAMDSATVEAWGSATVKAMDSATVEAWGSATVKAWGSATVIAPVGSGVKRENIVLSHNSTFKDCNTKTIYQSGDWKLELVESVAPVVEVGDIVEGISRDI